MAEIFRAADVKKKDPVRKSMEKIRKVIAKIGREDFFTQFVTFPKAIAFEQQEKGEEVVLFLRQHIIVNLPWMILVVIALAVSSVFEFFPPYAAMPLNYQIVVSLVWYLLTFGYALGNMMAWFFNIYILTDERVVDVDFIHLLKKRISVTKIDTIQDVTATVAGAAGTIFHYGNIRIQTAAQRPEFEFANVPHPDKIAAIIHELIDQEEQEKLEGRVK
jgi:hypothetical protein